MNWIFGIASLFWLGYCIKLTVDDAKFYREFYSTGLTKESESL